MQSYLTARAAGEAITQRRFAEANAVNLLTFKWHLRKHGHEVAKSLGLDIERRDPPRVELQTRVQLTDRDVQLLYRLGHDRVHDVPFLASLWFSSSQQPTKSAMTRLRLLERAGYIQILLEQLPLVTLTAKGARRVGVQARPMHPRHLHHHLATLRAIELYKKDVEASGGRLLERQMANGQSATYLLEFHIQAEERSGTGTAAGTRYEAAPDAIVFAELPDPKTGELRAQRVALEFFTAAYSDTQIRSKAAFFHHFDAVHQVADTATTAHRVSALTRAPCLIQGRTH